MGLELRNPNCVYNILEEPSLVRIRNSRSAVSRDAAVAAFEEGELADEPTMTKM